MRIGRLIRHTTATHWRTRMLFPPATLDAIEQAIKRAEMTHAGEIRFAIETALTPRHVLNDVTPHAHALEVFSHLRVWDTERNNGVLVYVQLADRTVEIVADRGFQGRVGPAEWEAVCRLMEEHFRAGRSKSDRLREWMPSATYWRVTFPRPPAGRFRPINCLIARLCCR